MTLQNPPLYAEINESGWRTARTLNPIVGLCSFCNLPILNNWDQFKDTRTITSPKLFIDVFFGKTGLQDMVKYDSIIGTALLIFLPMTYFFAYVNRILAVVKF